MGSFWSNSKWNCKDCDKNVDCIKTRAESRNMDLDELDNAEFERCDEFAFNDLQDSLKVTSSGAGSFRRSLLGKGKILSINARKDCVNIVEKVRSEGEKKSY